MKHFNFKIEGRSYNVDILNADDKLATVNVNGALYEVGIEPKKKTPKPLHKVNFVPSTDIPSVKTKSENGTNIIRSPLPGQVIEVMVKEGETISIGQTVIRIDAMKMENNIRADREGAVKSICVKINDAVMEGDTLLEIV